VQHGQFTTRRTVRCSRASIVGLPALLASREIRHPSVNARMQTTFFMLRPRDHHRCLVRSQQPPRWTTWGRVQAAMPEKRASHAFASSLESTPFTADRLGVMLRATQADAGQEGSLLVGRPRRTCARNRWQQRFV